MTESMLEKLIRDAQLAANTARDLGEEEWCSEEMAREAVRAVLLSLREPDEGMVGAVGSEWGPALEANWQAMIDHILNESGSSTPT